MKVSIQTTTFLCLAALIGADGVHAKRLARGPFDVSTPTLTKDARRRINTNTNTNTKPAFVVRNHQRISNSGSNSNTLIPRGGACSDSDPALFFKIAFNALAESAALLGILLGSVKYANSISATEIFNEPLPILLASMLVVFGSSFVGAIVGGGLSAATNQALNPNKVLGDPNWYANLKKPTWNPPGWLFPIMWLVVSKPTQLCATSRIFKYGLTRNEGGVVTAVPLVPLAVYTTMLALGNAWNKVFFGLECIGRGTVVITFFYAALLASAYLFYQIDDLAGYYMLPTCGWVTVATALQYSIYFLNKGDGSSSCDDSNGDSKKKKRFKKK